MSIVDRLKSLLFIGIVLNTSLNTVLAQNESLKSLKKLNGVITYISKESIYTRFTSTQEIQLGDTLYSQRSGIAAMIVLKKSSISTINSRIGSDKLAIGDTIFVFASNQLTVVTTTDTTLSKTNIRDGKNQVIRSADSIVRKNIPREKNEQSWNWHGYSSISSRYNQTLASEANRAYNQQYGRFNIRGVKNDSLGSLGVQISGNYQHFRSEFSRSETPALGRLYLNQAELHWKINSALQLKMGRGFQNGLSSMGALDAVRLGYKISHLQLEAIGGFAPDYRTHQFSTNIPVIGLTVRTEQYQKDLKWDASLGWMDQYANGNIDRRLLLMQASVFNKKSYLYVLLENDFTQGLGQSRLQSTYVSLQQKLTPKWNAFVSYDTRTPWIYWRSYDQLTIDDLVEREAQRGFRVRLSCRASKNVNWGIQSTLRTTNFKKDMVLLGVNVTRNNLFWKGSSLSYRLNITDYNLWQNAQQIVRWSKHHDKTQFSMYYRSNLFSRRIELGSVFNQNSVGLQYSFPLKKSFELDVFSEYNLQQQQQHLFCYITLSKRF